MFGLMGFLLLVTFPISAPADDERRPSVHTLTQELGSASAAVRSRAAQALGKRGPDASSAVAALVRCLQDENEEVRWKASRALIAIGRPAVPALTRGLTHSMAEVRRESAFALGRIGRGAESAVATLTQALKDSDPDVCRYAAFALGHMGSAAQSAVPALQAMATESDAALAKAAGEALERIRDSHVQSTDSVKTPSDDAEQARGSNDAGVRSAGSKSVDGVEASRQRPGTTEPSSEAHAVASQPMEEPATEPREAHSHWAPATSGEANASAMPAHIPWWTAAQFGLWVAFWGFLWTAVLFIEPLWLWMVEEWLWRHLRWQSPRWLGGWSVTPGSLCLLGYFSRRQRVLDAWVRLHASAARENLWNDSRTRPGKTRLPVPVKCQDREIGELNPRHIAPAFRQHPVRLTMTGDGGTGKTTLAYQIADWCLEGRLGRHHMLPVLIDEEADLPVVDVVRNRLAEFIGGRHPVSQRWLDRLLESQRVLVVVDDVPAISRAIDAELPTVPTLHIGRSDDLLPSATVRLQPCRLSGDHLTTFLSRFLILHERRDRFADVDLFDACRRLSVLTVGGEPTALLATMYAEYLIAADDEAEHQSSKAEEEPLVTFSAERVQHGTATLKRSRIATSRPAPQHMPDLVRSFFEAVARRESAECNSHILVHDLEQIAGMIFDTTGGSHSVGRAAVATKLGPHVVERLENVYEPLGLIQFSRTGGQRLRFRSRTLAEYLAAMHAVRTQAGCHNRWKDQLAHIDRRSLQGSSQTGFLQALWDCCLAAADDVPDFVLPELGRRCGLRPEVVERVRVPLQIRRFVFGLKSLDVTVRESAARGLGQFGPAAADAVSALVEALHDEDVGRTAADALRNIGRDAVMPLARALDSAHHQVRRLAAVTLGQMGTEAYAAAAALRAALNDSHHMVRANAVKALALIDPDECVPSLIDALRDTHGYVVATAACSLGQLGSAAALAAPVLARTLQHPLVEVRRLAVDTLGRIGPAAGPAIPALIKALRDQSFEVRVDAAKALGLLGSEAITRLVETLSSPDPDSRASAAFALGIIRPDGRSVIRSLILTLKDPYEAVRIAATETLERIHRQERETAATLPFAPRSIEEPAPLSFTARAA